LIDDDGFDWLATEFDAQPLTGEAALCLTQRGDRPDPQRPIGESKLQRISVDR
jgi:hypothetical protein